MPEVLVFLFDRGGEDVVGRARTEAARALVRRLARHPAVAQVVVSTPVPDPWQGTPATVEPDPPGPWRYGARLNDLVRKYRPERLLYVSAGSAFLLGDDELDRVVTAAPCPPPYAVLNNFYSTDFALIAPPGPVADLARDNPLGIRLWQAGYTCYELPRSAATQLDIDTPGELQVLALHPDLPDGLRRVLAEIPIERARHVVRLLADPEAEVLLLGRVGGHLLRYLEMEAACRVRVVSEERGMEASGRAERGAVRSLLGILVGSPVRLVQVLSELGDGVVWDTRVLMAHLGTWPPAEERFAADLLQYDKVGHPFLRDLVRACAEAPTPFLLGGHSLVSGGMYLAAELAWLNADREVRCRPLSFPG